MINIAFVQNDPAKFCLIIFVYSEELSCFFGMWHSEVYLFLEYVYENEAIHLVIQH